MIVAHQGPPPDDSGTPRQRLQTLVDALTAEPTGLALEVDAVKALVADVGSVLSELPAPTEAPLHLLSLLSEYFWRGFHRAMPGRKQIERPVENGIDVAPWQVNEGCLLAYAAGHQAGEYENALVTMQLTQRSDGVCHIRVVLFAKRAPSRLVTP